MRERFLYTAFGLHISSEIALPELPVGCADRAADVTIRCESPLSTVCERAEAHQTASEVQFAWPGVGKFRVSNGVEIFVAPAMGVSDAFLRLPLMGTVFAMLLHQRGFLVLHASAIKIEEQAVAFAGPRGRGKSTVCAALYQRGHSLISDDILAIDLTDRDAWAIPGLPFFKLWPDAMINGLGERPDDYPRMIEGYEKRGRVITERLVREPVRLRYLYLLEDDADIHIAPLDRSELMMSCVVHSIAARFGSALLYGVDQVRHFQLCAKAVGQISGARLLRPRRFERLPELIRMIEGAA